MLCVFTTGQAWQFKSYKWTDPRELFKHGTSPRVYEPALKLTLG